jgi:hypothetical protein
MPKSGAEILGVCLFRFFKKAMHLLRYFFLSALVQFFDFIEMYIFAPEKTYFFFISTCSQENANVGCTSTWCMSFLFVQESHASIEILFFYQHLFSDLSHLTS